MKNHDSEINLNYLIAPRADLRIGTGALQGNRGTAPSLTSKSKRTLTPARNKAARAGTWMGRKATQTWKITRATSGIRTSGPGGRGAR